MITILTPCFNEAENVEVLFARVQEVMGASGVSDYLHMFIDNGSSDGTQEKLRKLAAEDLKIRLIFNQRNFGHVRSPFHGLLQAPGDAVIVMAADLQDPPELIPEFIKKWREGYPVVVGQKVNSEESWLFFTLRRGHPNRVRDHKSY